MLSAEPADCPPVDFSKRLARIAIGSVWGKLLVGLVGGVVVWRDPPSGIPIHIAAVLGGGTPGLFCSLAQSLTPRLVETSPFVRQNVKTYREVLLGLNL